MDDAALQNYMHRGCRARKATFYLQEFMLLFKGVGRLLSNVWTLLKNN
jgi:hypothetical protein